jgi:hypothetical protein
MNMPEALVASRPLFRSAAQILDRLELDALAERGGKQRQYALFLAVNRKPQRRFVGNPGEDSSSAEHQAGAGNCE